MTVTVVSFCKYFLVFGLVFDLLRHFQTSLLAFVMWDGNLSLLLIFVCFTVQFIGMFVISRLRTARQTESRISQL